MVCDFRGKGSFEVFRQTQRGRPIGGEPENPSEDIGRPVTGHRTQSQLSTRGPEADQEGSKAASKTTSRVPTPRGKTPGEKQQDEKKKSS